MTKPPSSPPTYLKYASLATEMIASVVLGAWVGQYLDNDYWALEFPVCTILLIFLGLTATFWRLIRSLNHDNKP
jgi:F0F1-type ATP synthase assembly protein I